MSAPSNDDSVIATKMLLLEAKLAQATKLLIVARHFDNLTVRDSGAVAVWRRDLDDWMRGRPGDDPKDRYDTPERIAGRRVVDGLFRHRGSL